MGTSDLPQAGNPKGRMYLTVCCKFPWPYGTAKICACLPLFSNKYEHSNGSVNQVIYKVSVLG